MAAAAESCQSKRCARGRLGRRRTRLHRIRRRFKHFWPTQQATEVKLARLRARARRAPWLPHRWRIRCRRLPTTRPTSRGRQEPELPPEKSVQFGPMAPRPVKNVNYPGPSSRRSGLVGPYTTARDSQLQIYDIYTARRVLLAAHAWDVNILIWTRASRSIMEQMIASWSMVMVHGLMVAGPGLEPNIARWWARETDDPRRASLGLRAM